MKSGPRQFARRARPRRRVDRAVPVAWHSIRKPIPLAPECTAACADVPCQCRGKVYVFLMSGFDPLRHRSRRRFPHGAHPMPDSPRFTTASSITTRFFASEMRRLAVEEPDARFVVVGFSLGADVRRVAGRIRRPSRASRSRCSHPWIPYWWSSAPTQDAAERATGDDTFTANLCCFANRTSAGTDVQIPETFPTNITANPLTVESLARALASIAGTLPHRRHRSTPAAAGGRSPDAAARDADR